MDLSAYRKITRSNVNEEQFKRDLEYAEKVDKLGLKAPNKIPYANQSQSQSNNPPSVKQPGGTLPKANNLEAAKQVVAKQTPVKQMGIGFNKTTPQPLPYANKVAQTLPVADQRKVQDKAYVARVLSNHYTPEELRQQSLANIKAEGQRTVDNINKKLERVDAALKSNNWMGKISATGDALINNAVKGAQERVSAYDNAPAFGTKEYAEWTMKNRGRITDPSIDRLIVNTAKKFDIDPTQYSPATQEFLKDEQEARERLMDGLSDSEKTVAEVAVAIGDVLQNKMIEATTGVPYKAIMATTGGTEAMQRKLSEGKSAAEAGLYGTGSAAISAGIESLGGIGGGVAGTTTGKLIMKKLPEKVAAYLFNLADSALVRMGISAGSESFEEAAEYVAQWAWESLNEGKVMPFSWDELKHNAKIGGWTGGAFEGINIAVNGKSQLNPDDYITEDGYLPNRGENATSAEMAGRLDAVYGADDAKNPIHQKLGETQKEFGLIDSVTMWTDENYRNDPDREKAKNGDEQAAKRLVDKLVTPEFAEKVKQKYPDAVIVPVVDFERTANSNVLPAVFASKLSDMTGLTATLKIGKMNTTDRAHAKNALERLMQRAEFSGEVIPGKQYYLMADDFVSTGFTLADLKRYIESKGGKVVGAVTLAATNEESLRLTPTVEELERLNGYDRTALEDILRSYQITDNIENLSRAEIQKIAAVLGKGEKGGYKGDELYNRLRTALDAAQRSGNERIVSKRQNNLLNETTAENGGFSMPKNATQPALPYNPNAAKPIPQNPAQGKIGGNAMGIVANPEAVARAQERREYFQPKPNPEGSRNFEGSVLDNLGSGETAFASLNDLLAQSKADAAKKPGAKEGVANVLTERPKKGVKENIEIAADFAARKLIDSGRTIDTIGKAVDDKVLYPLYNNAKQSRQAAEYMIGDAQTDINGNRVGESLVSIFEPIKSKGEEYFRDFSTYLYHVHNVDRMSLETNGAQVYQDAIMQLEMENPMLQNATREEVEALASGNSDYREAAIEWLQLDDSLNDLHNKPVFGESVTAEDSNKAATELLRKNPEFRELAEKVYAYNRNLMKYRVDAGLVSQKQADIMNALYPHYVPTFRDTSSTTGMKMGGNQATVARTVRSATGSNLDLMPIDGSMAEQTLQTVRAAKTNIFGARLLEDALKHQDKVGRHIRSVVDKYNSYDMDEPPQYTGGVTIYSAGKPVSMDADVGVMEAFKSIQPDPLEGSNIYRRIVDANNTFKALVTGANPMFLAKNFARDLQDAGLYAGDLKDFAKNYPKAWKEIKNNGELWQLYKSQGGTGSSYFDYEKGLVDNKRKGVLGKAADKVEAANMMVEQAPRFAEFMSVLEKEGRTYEGVQKAMLAAADVTVNFGRSGTLTKTLNKTFVPFLNPSIQGADKFVRRFAQTKGAKEWLDLIGRCALLGIAPALLNELLHAGTEEEEEYEMLNDRDKETNYVFSIGDGVWVKIPRGRAVSIFGSAAQRTARMLKGDEDAWTGFIELALDQVGTTDPFTGHILSSYLNTELFNPESPGKTWYGGDIEPQRLRSLPPGERYDEKTDNLSKWLGKQLNISPKKINHLLDSYTGVIGDFALPLMTPRAERNPVAAAFSIDSTTSNKLQGEFYDKLDALEQNKNSANPDAGTDLAYSYLNGVSREVSELNKQIRAIEGDETIKDKDKREQTRKLADERNDLIKEALEVLPQYTEKAAAYKGGPDAAKREVNRKQFGAEYALKKYDKDVYAKAQQANSKGVSYEDYYNYRFSVDANGDGSVNQEEAKKKLDSMNLTMAQKAYMWKLQNKSWKNNPYER